MKPDFSGWLKRSSAGPGGRLMSAAARCERFGDKPRLGRHKTFTVRHTAAWAAEVHSCRRGQLQRSVCRVKIAGLGRLWVRSAGFALAFAVFASALLGPAPVWSQSLSGPVLSFTATTDAAVEGEDDVGLRIGLPSQLIGQRVVLEITAGGTAVLGTDYRLIAADPEQTIVLGDSTMAVTITLEVPTAPAAELRLLLRPRSDDRIRQGDRNLSLAITGVTAAAGTGGSLVLPAVLRLSIRDDEPAPTVAVRIVAIGWGGAIGCAERSDASIRCWDQEESILRFAPGSAIVRIGFWHCSFGS